MTLAASTGAARTFGCWSSPIDDHRVLTVELLADRASTTTCHGSGVVVHLVDDSPEQCGATTRCTDLERVQQIVAADESATDTLLRAGDRVTVSRRDDRAVDSIDAGEVTVTAAT